MKIRWCANMKEKKSLKILMVTDAYYPYPSGVSEYVHNLSCALRGRGHTVDIVATSFGRREDRKYDVIRVGRVVYVPLNRSYATVPFGFDIPAKMKHLIQGRQYDVVHLNGPIFPNLSYFALKYSNTRTISTFLTSSERVTGFGSGLFRRIFERLYDKIDVRIAISEQAQRTNEMYVPGEYYIVPLGVDVKRFSRDGDKYPEMKNKSILFVGRMDPRKGLHRLLRSFVLVREKMPDARLFIVGGGPGAEKYRRMVDSHGIADSVLFRGQVSNSHLAKYFRSCTVYTSPAEGGESFGLVLIEAMASGVPVVASDIAGYNEVVQNGRNGVLVDTADPDKYAAALLHVLQDGKLRKNLVSEGLKDIETRYRWDVIARQIEQFYFA
jgi:phosphatidylinositol alpha-mannosyltransferase